MKLLYLCNKKNPFCGGMESCEKIEAYPCQHTTDVRFAANGPIRNEKDIKERFVIEEGVLIEKAEE